MPQRPKQFRSAALTPLLAAFALGSLLPMRRALGQAATGCDTSAQPPMTAFQSRSPKQTTQDLERLAAAQARRDRRKVKQAINARRTVLGKPYPSLAEVKRAQRLIEEIYA